MAEEKLEARIAKLEARIQELEDERAIRELLARYGYNADCCRDQEYIDLYTEDGAIELRTNEGDGMRFQGAKELREFITNPAGHSEPSFYGKSMHVQGNNLTVHLSGESAKVNSYSFVFKADGNNFRPFSAGNNQWTLRKVGGKWLIQERRRYQMGGNLYTKNLDATPK
jgi:hypothetical protein